MSDLGSVSEIIPPSGRPTGPRSELGKRRSSRNALKHGILSSVVLLPSEPGEKYGSLLKGFEEALRPEGGLEVFLVEKLATVAWRSRRLLIAEVAEIRRGSEFVEWEKENREIEQSASRERPDLEKVFDADPPLISKIQDRYISVHCIELLGDLREAIEEGGFDKERDTRVLEQLYGIARETRRTLVEIYERWFFTAQASEEERQQAGCATPAQCRERVLSDIQCEIERIRRYQRQQEANEKEQSKLDCLRRYVPESEMSDRLLRYEASLERSFDRTLNQLERMQRLRRGQPVAPRIEVGIAR